MLSGNWDSSFIGFSQHEQIYVYCWSGRNNKFDLMKKYDFAITDSKRKMNGKSIRNWFSFRIQNSYINLTKQCDEINKPKKKSITFFLNWIFLWPSYTIRFVWFWLLHDELCERDHIDAGIKCDMSWAYIRSYFSRGYLDTTPETLCFHRNNINSKNPVGHRYRRRIWSAAKGGFFMLKQITEQNCNRFGSTST